MRILVVNPFGGTEVYGRENLARLARPDTEFDIVNISDVFPLHNNQWLYFRYGCTEGTIDRVLLAEKQGYDAVFISCMLDIGLYECRELVDIPVTGSLESAVLMAHVMCNGKYSILSVDYQDGQMMRMVLDMYGLSGKLASIRPFNIDANDLYPGRSTPEQVIEQIVSTARLCIEQDQAEVLIPGCTLASSVLTKFVSDSNNALGVPAIDGMVTGFKMAEMMADMHKAGVPIISRRGFFEKPPVDQFNLLRDFLGKPR
jgi:allantoin racemase